MTCERCGCTDEAACLIDVPGFPEGTPCWWVLPEVCSACATPEELARRNMRADGGLGDVPRLGDAAPAPALLYDAYGVRVR